MNRTLSIVTGAVLALGGFLLVGKANVPLVHAQDKQPQETFTLKRGEIVDIFAPYPNTCVETILLGDPVDFQAVPQCIGGQPHVFVSLKTGSKHISSDMIVILDDASGVELKYKLVSP